MPGAARSRSTRLPASTFARGLRTILRSDPDVILVGEIRDEETARIAMQAATTGHLVLSTLHAQSASSSIVRLKDMGVDPGLLAPSLNCIVAQRLARRLCLECRERTSRPTRSGRGRPRRDSATSTSCIGRVAAMPASRPASRARVALYEAMSVEGKIRRLIDGTTEEIFAAAVEQGMIDAPRERDPARRSRASPRSARSAASPAIGCSRRSAATPAARARRSPSAAAARDPAPRRAL